ncbi:MAG TPA: response regulator [Candidatus Binataceae bacterium]|nr:response regulator [Candidatus Binataceae bacterium]
MILSALIIDDSPFARKIIRHHLLKLGIRVVAEAENAAQGLDLFRELKPTLVTLDVMMPERNGISSMTAFQAIRKEAPETAMVVVSAIPFEKTRDTFLNEGAMAYVIKPFNQFSFEPVRQKLQRIFPAALAQPPILTNRS